LRPGETYRHHLELRLGIDARREEDIVNQDRGEETP